MSTTLASLKTVLCGASPGDQGILQDSSYYAAITTDINLAVTTITAGIRMPDGQVSPPSPLLYDMATVATSITLPYVALPAAAGHVYQRNVFMVVDSNGNQIYGPRGGSYYDFALFLKQASHKGLTQAGAVSSVCVKGPNLYYQGIPSASKTLTIHFYRTPVAMTTDGTTVDGLPDNLATHLIKHWVAFNIFGEGLEDSNESRKAGYTYHKNAFYEAMVDYCDWAGIDAVPEYYGTGGYSDLGVCD